MSESGHVVMKVFDVSGKESAILIDRIIEPGAHSLLFNAKELPGGIYFLSMEVNGTGRAVKKMILLK